MTRSVKSKLVPKRIAYVLIIMSVCLTLYLRNLKSIGNLLKKTLFFTKIKIENKHLRNYKYILSWSKNYLIARNGKYIFPNLKCRVKKCIFTEDRNFLKNYTHFDAIIFTEDILVSEDRPFKRSPSQTYIFTTVESSYNAPACELYNDGFFNWTFTYRLDSDVVWQYFVVRNRKGSVVAPSREVKWNRSLRPVSNKIKTILASKRKAAAWIVSHCRADSLRDEYLTMLQKHLFYFGLGIDMYGGCSKTRCPNDRCEEMLKKNYYFYMAFENSISVDYVTEKVLHGYYNYAVPIVYGGANYSRFLPPGSYLNAREMHPYNLAVTIHEAMQTPSSYEEYFKWRNLYMIDGNMKSHHPLCKLCEALKRRKRNVPAKKNFRLWWNGLNGMKWCLSNDYWNETANVNVDAKHVFDLY